MNEPITIPGYTVHELLGKGGMASVYLATQESLGRRVAIKVLSEFGDEHAETRFFTEARTIASLNHPRIVTVFDVGHLENGLPYLSMEYLGGGDLSQLKNQALVPRHALELVKQVAEGLSVVHNKGIIHRDIKPANILFREDGSVALSDFGIAKDLSVDTELTQAGVSVGSPSYSSPEQIYGQQLDARSDIYSLGVVLLEMLSGSNPYKGKNYAETVVNHTQKPLPDLEEIDRDCRAVLRRMLARDPDNRYGSVSELIDDINAILTRAPEQDEAATAFRPAATPGAGLQTNLQDQARSLLQQLAGNRIIIAVSATVALALIVILLSYETETDREIKRLLEQADASLEQDQLITPEFENARYYYNQILVLDPGNGDAEDGLEEVNELLVERYLQLASTRFEETRLSRPKDDSAVFYYNQALALEPDNESAQEGLARVTEEYLRLAREAFNKKRYDEGLGYVRSGLALEPEHALLLELHEQYKDKGSALKRILNNVFN